MKTRRIAGFALAVVALAAPFVGWAQRWNIYDALRLRGYQPPAQIVQLATDTAMNDKTRRLFYVYHPELADKQSFKNTCRSSEKTIVLGCYISGTGIYLYNVTDERLAGVIQVTAAHEILHAGYDRLGASEKQSVNKLIDQAYSRVTNQRIRDTVEDYRKNDADIANELHSILGTEVRDLPPELEQYYAQYFTNRLKVVEYSEKYEQVFKEIELREKELKERIEKLKLNIDTLNAKLTDFSAKLQAEASSLEAERANAASNPSAFNARVANYNSQVGTYNREVRLTGQLIDEHNQLIIQYNATVLEQNELIKAIDSRPDTLPAQ